MRQARACASCLPARVVPVPEARLARPLALAGGLPAVPVLRVCGVHLVLAGAAARTAASGQLRAASAQRRARP